MKTETISIKVTKELKDKLNDAVKSNKTSMSAFIANAIENKLNDNICTIPYGEGITKNIGVIANSIDSISSETDKSKIRDLIIQFQDAVIKIYESNN